MVAKIVETWEELRAQASLQTDLKTVSSSTCRHFRHCFLPWTEKASAVAIYKKEEQGKGFKFGLH
jgi:hypothetical protein